MINLAVEKNSNSVCYFLLLLLLLLIFYISGCFYFPFCIVTYAALHGEEKLN